MSSNQIRNDSFRLSWEDLSDHITGYLIRIKHASDGKVILEEEIPIDQKSLKISGLLAASKYRVEIGSMRFNEISEMESSFVQTIPNAPKISIQSITAKSAILIIKGPMRGSSFVAVLTNGGTNVQKIRINNRKSLTLTGLEPGSYYNLSIATLFESQISDKTEETFLTIPDTLQQLRLVSQKKALQNKNLRKIKMISDRINK